MSLATRAQAAYEAYAGSAAVAWKAPATARMPRYADLTAEVQAAWEAFAAECEEGDDAEDVVEAAYTALAAELTWKLPFGDRYERYADLAAGVVTAYTAGATAAIAADVSDDPTYTSVAPVLGNTAGGTEITITGTQLTGTTGVTIGGEACTSVVVVDSTTVTAVSPAKAAGTYDLVLTTPNGSVTETNAFTTQDTPTVTDTSPVTAATAGGTSLTLTGTNFTGATSVTVGGTACTSVVVVNSTTITCASPAKTAGVYNVAVTTPAGTGTQTNGLTVQAAPTVTSIDPATGSMLGGTSVSITGTGFTGATSVTIGGEACTSVVVVNSTTITADSPVLVADTYDVVVTTPQGSGTLTDGFTTS